jgi:hypothetical protein
METFGRTGWPYVTAAIRSSVNLVVESGGRAPRRRTVDADQDLAARISSVVDRDLDPLVLRGATDHLPVE